MASPTVRSKPFTRVRDWFWRLLRRPQPPPPWYKRLLHRSAGSRTEFEPAMSPLGGSAGLDARALPFGSS